MTALPEYACERADIFTKLHDQEWFVNFIKYQYKDIFFKSETVNPQISEYMLMQAHEHWVSDVGRISSNEYNGKNLDHFKHSAILCFWLRRFPAITDYFPDPSLKAFGQSVIIDNKDLFNHGVHQASFDIGFRICSYWEAMRADCEDVYGKILEPGDFKIGRHKEFTNDVGYVLSEKNVSPHTLNLIYKSLFLQLL